MKKIFSLSCLLLLSHFPVFSQDFNWWNELHDWDGVSSWKKYITYSSRYMGPNALPVPAVNTGELFDYTEIELGAEQHISTGDRTFDFLGKFNIPVAPGRVSLQVLYRPVEFYETDTITRDQRAARGYDPTGHSFGDFYISTFIQVIKDHDKLPDLLLAVNLKTASGTNLGNARHTDAPGYFFDASLGKTFLTGIKVITSWRPYFMGGFYSYQTNRSDFPQNDAFLFGMGLKIYTTLLVIENQVGGYLGYFGNGDQPVVYRLQFLSRRDSLLNYQLGFQYGIHDVPYYSFALSAVLRFDNLKFFWGNDK